MHELFVKGTCESRSATSLPRHIDTNQHWLVLVIGTAYRLQCTGPASQLTCHSQLNSSTAHAAQSAELAGTHSIFCQHGSGNGVSSPHLAAQRPYGPYGPRHMQTGQCSCCYSAHRPGMDPPHVSAPCKRHAPLTAYWNNCTCALGQTIRLGHVCILDI